MTLTPGTAVERYIIQGVIGEGAMAIVYQAKHRDLGSLHALKQLTRPESEIRERLVQEGRLQSTLNHPNVVSVTDLVLIDELPVLVMEYVSGPTLQELLRQGPLSFPQVDALASGIIRGVAAAHAHGLVHRDLKPGNILIAPTSDTLIPKIADFGLAKVLEEGGEALLATQSGSSMGTPAYMAPEQIQDSSTVDARADVFALGAILYELVTGSRCFEGDQLIALWRNICAGTYTPVAKRKPEAPTRMVKAIEGALMPEPEERIQDVSTLLSIWFEGQDPLGDITLKDEAPVWPEAMREDIRALASSPTRPEVSAESDAIGLVLSMAVSPPPSPISGSLSPDAKPGFEPQASSAQAAWPKAIGALLLISLGAIGAWSLQSPPPEQTRTPNEHTLTLPQKKAPESSESQAAMKRSELGESESAQKRHTQDFTTRRAEPDSKPDKAFTLAERALIEGEFGKAEQALLEQPGERAMRHGLLALTYFLEEKKGLYSEHLRLALSLSEKAPSFEMELIRLSEKSAHDSSDKESLTLQWRHLLKAQDTPIVRLFYLVAGEALLSPEALQAAFNAAHREHPKLIAARLLELRFVAKHEGDKEAFRRAEEALAQQPSSRAIRVFRDTIALRLERYDGLEGAFKKLLEGGAPLIDARVALAELYVATERESGRMEALLVALSDTNTSSDQLKFLELHGRSLVNHGRLGEASKTWDLCVKMGVEAESYVQAAQCAMSALDALRWLEIEGQDARWRVLLTQALDQGASESPTMRLYRTLLLWHTISSELRNGRGKVDASETLLKRVLDVPNDALPAGSKEMLLSDIRFELAMNAGESTKLLRHLKETQSKHAVGLGIPSCTSLQDQGRIGERLKDQAMAQEADSLLAKGACTSHPYLGIQRAKARAARIERKLAEKATNEARKELGAFFVAWPNADEELELLKRVRALEKRL